MYLRCILVVTAVIGLLAALVPPPAEPPLEKIPILLDTDIGTDIDDAFALALILASPELDLRGITTVGAPARRRAPGCCADS